MSKFIVILLMKLYKNNYIAVLLTNRQHMFCINLLICMVFSLLNTYFRF
jgi:hypothetical protein